MGFERHYEARQQIVEYLSRDLCGPQSEDEVLTDPPITRYAVGVLYPVTAGNLDPSQHHDAVDELDDYASDPAVSLANARYPSSLGITFAVVPDAPNLIISVKAARYEPEMADAKWDGDVLASHPSPAGSRMWRRIPIYPEPFLLDPRKVGVVREWVDEDEGLQLYWRVRPQTGGAIPITVASVNRRTARPAERDAASYFQPEIEVRAEDDSPAFVEREGGGAVTADPDLLTTRLIYRHARTFAVGHGTAASWEPESGAERVRVVRTSLIPTVEVRLSDSNPGIHSPALRMSLLANVQRRSETVADLRAFVDGYRQWISSQRALLGDIPDPLRDTATANVGACERAAERMLKGIGLLATSDPAWEAFTLANKAMLRQRARTEWLKLDPSRRPADPPEDSGHTWRPFQLGFILQCLDSIADPSSPDRDVTDLLWFPTGGGKTEAYLGLIAFTIFHRRLTAPNDSGGGVTVLMRYTLRLLTTQQFERAALLITSCESIRLERLATGDKRLGSQPIGIGLWVGQDASPNTRSDASKALDKLRAGARLEKGNPVQLHSCPWCGTRLDAWKYYVRVQPDRLAIDCKNAACKFSGGKLPVYVVDEDIYDHRPTLVIATVDKFASLPWRERTRELFNIGSPEAPPELIIQDELHLISGPLGTMTGLYETAVDLLCSHDGRPPKVIASTATIRRASDQAASLFARKELTQFPPQALDARDSYFAVEAPPDQKGTRLYVGLMAPGVSHTTLMVRTYAALLQAAHELDCPDEVKDAYWTLVGFFNSLRVLGGARMQVNDDVKDRVRLLAGLHGTEPRFMSDPLELTSRASSADIPQALAEMAISMPDPGVRDVILATNMISVGVDIDRLGLMAVMGQPPSTSEYIQATSRVGRGWPGLVVTILNAARSRDRSHYELFTGYHGALYRQVEATSVTPFSPRARNRGLHAAIVALARLTLDEFSSNEGASAIRDHELALAYVRDAISTRILATAPEEHDATMKEVDEIIQTWKRRALENPNLVYNDLNDPSRALLISAGEERAADVDAWETLWSLRDVDRASNLYVVR